MDLLCRIAVDSDGVSGCPSAHTLAAHFDYEEARGMINTLFQQSDVKELQICIYK